MALVFKPYAVSFALILWIHTNETVHSRLGARQRGRIKTQVKFETAHKVVTRKSGRVSRVATQENAARKERAGTPSPREGRGQRPHRGPHFFSPRAPAPSVAPNHYHSHPSDVPGACLPLAWGVPLLTPAVDPPPPPSPPPGGSRQRRDPLSGFYQRRNNCGTLRGGVIVMLLRVLPPREQGHGAEPAPGPSDDCEVLPAPSPLLPFPPTGAPER